MEEQSVIDHIIEMKGDISSIKTTLDESLKPLVDKVNAQDTRLGRVETDVKSAKRIFGGLWLLVIAGVGAVAAFLRGN